MVGYGAHDAGDIVQGDEDEQGDEQAIQPAQEIAEPSAQGRNGDLDLRPDQINMEITNSSSSLSNG